LAQPKAEPAGAAMPERPVVAVPWTPEGLRAAWPDVVKAAARHSRFLAQSLDSGQPTLGAHGEVIISFGPQQAMAREGVERQSQVVETIVSARMGTNVKVSVSGATEVVSRPGRLTVEDIRRERLSELRRRDPALDAAAEALDLELVDDG
jgi:hypothetical protein